MFLYTCLVYIFIHLIDGKADDMERKCLAIGIIILFLTIGFSPIINAQLQQSSVGSLMVRVVIRGHQDYPVVGALVVLVDKDKHSLIRFGLTDFSGDKTFYLLPIDDTYVIRVLFHHYGHFHSTSVKVTTYDSDEWVLLRFQ
jgi:hypothetical protein